jgi:hypothetical protein
LHNAGTITCSGIATSLDRHEYVDDIGPHLPFLETARTQKGTIKVNQSRIPKHPQEWWKAQGAFCGLNTKGVVKVLQDQLQTSEKPMLQELVEWQEKMDKKFRERTRPWKTIYGRD